MKSYRQRACLFACALLCAGCGRNRTNEPSAPVSGEPWTVPDLGLGLVPVPAGSFRMGSGDALSGEKPVHEVRITRAFWMGRQEVTQAEYEALTGTNPSRYKGANNPAEEVSWHDAVSFCGKLTDVERQAGRLPAGHESRLPTEAEWEYAARGGPEGRDTRYAGSDDLDEVAWYKDNSGGMAHEVGGKKANELGLYDMSGNLYEWCLDWRDEEYYAKSPPADPTGPAAGSFRVVRGGGWYFGATFCRVPSRNAFTPTFADVILGFRVVLAPTIQPPGNDAEHQ